MTLVLSRCWKRNMDKDKFETQSGGHIKEGHQESDVSVKGVVWSGVILARRRRPGICADDSA